MPTLPDSELKAVLILKAINISCVSENTIKKSETNKIFYIMLLYIDTTFATYLHFHLEMHRFCICFVLYWYMLLQNLLLADIHQYIIFQV